MQDIIELTRVTKKNEKPGLYTELIFPRGILNIGSSRSVTIETCFVGKDPQWPYETSAACENEPPKQIKCDEQNYLNTHLEVVKEFKHHHLEAII